VITRQVIILAWFASLFWFMVLHVPMRFELKGWSPAAANYLSVRGETRWQRLWETSDTLASDSAGRETWRYTGIQYEAVFFPVALATVAAGSLIWLIRAQRRPREQGE
jgi:hypothetical protein